MLVQRVKEIEFDRTFDAIKELENAHPNVIPILFQYKMNDINQNIAIAEEVAKEFKSGKLDPKMALNYEKTQKALKKKGKLLAL